MFKFKYIYFLLLVMVLANVSAQEVNPYLSYDVPSQNLLKYNRFLINPTFSTVREDKSYINLLHRNQSVEFTDNNQNYFLSYSGRINDRTGLGLSIYQQTAGTLTNYGVLANYAYGVKLNDKSNFTFGANMSYYASGLDKSRVNAADPDDPFLNGQRDNLLQFQPGVNLSYGKFDIGLYAENLFDYNLKTSESITEFADKTFSGHLQYTHQFDKTSGILEQGRLMPLARVRKGGQEDVVLGGSLILDLPKLGWAQVGYDDHYGAAAGLGFNLNKRLSLGYTMEKGISGDLDNFGVTHEISVAYSFTPNLTEDRVMLEDDNDNELAFNEEDTNLDEELESEKFEELKKRLAENDQVLAELMYRQDSLEVNRQRDLEKRFERVLRMVRSETQGKRPDLEERAKKMYFINNDENAVAENTTNKPSGIEKDATTVVAPKTSTSGYQNATNNTIENATVATDATNTNTAIANNQKTTTVKTNASTIKRRKFKHLSGVQDGYYVIANVYKGQGYLNKFIKDLEDNGLSADYIKDPKTNLKYVYLERYDTWKEAEAAHNSKLNGAYDYDMWIMNVDNSSNLDSRYNNTGYAATTKDKTQTRDKYSNDNPKFRNPVQKDNVANTYPTPKIVKFNGVDAGYYIIANVFASAKNANNFVKLLNKQGLHASYFINPENNYRYVYLKKHGTWNNALLSYYSKINSSYQDRMWIMRVTQNNIA
ncbi:PorP/SprF family type IX secretion system membrane protein [Cellulophaga omnivescoria]|uniref:PorP/SprF family type IX secretion system membrane protein n=1 Tax=Cellulophaga omnivescoria TaxID=1888890 RepID=UPI000985F604|nr:type IX secretion system membrane protein PorP/SprF [Cellulophaga omnivescoria]WBU90658.1 type IX secretion system membrane protein PorP/SprF [Cellulophaga omnivescoria]